MLLAVDLGLRTGFACYGRDGRLAWYRSRNYGSRARLKRAAFTMLREEKRLTHLVVEGGGALADLWEREATRQGLDFRRIDAGEWRRMLLHPRERRTGKGAKEQADTLARAVITWSGASRPTSLRHDAAEAILVGLWGVVEAGWLALETLPGTVRRVGV
ncbi:MAG: hypothetical protein AAGG50_07015 [Bacteroidota bacterium]